MVIGIVVIIAAALIWLYYMPYPNAVTTTAYCISSNCASHQFSSSIPQGCYNAQSECLSVLNPPIQNTTVYCANASCNPQQIPSTSNAGQGCYASQSECLSSMNTTQSPQYITIYCNSTNCTPQQVQLGAGTLVQGCFRNQSECALSMITVNSVQNAQIGNSILVDSNGMTLYYFSYDSYGLSRCYGACAVNWPPLAVPNGTKPIAGPGVGGSLGVIQRTDGITQVTYNSLPVYLFFKDVNSGDVLGNGVYAFGGAWGVVTTGVVTGGGGGSGGGY